MVRKKISIVLSTLMLLGAVSGCGTKKDDKNTGNTTKEKITITSVRASNTNQTTDALTGGDPNKIPWVMELEKRTGVHVDYINVTADDYDTKVSIMIASDDVPDMFGLPSNYAGGLSKAAEDGVIAKINNYWDKFAPNYKAAATARAEVAKDVKADNGDVYTFCNIKEDKLANVYFGPMIRKDLLDKAGLGVPETIDEWYTALKAFKDMGVKTPFTTLNWFMWYSGAFVGAYNAGYDTIVNKDGKFVYGPIQPGFKEYLTTMNKWYKEGLIDPDYVTLTDWGALDAKMASGNAVSTLHFLSNVAGYTKSAKEKDPKAVFVPTKYPVLKKGDQPMYGQCDRLVIPGACVSAKSKNIERVMQYLDYGYSQEGQQLFNFGIEGESYTLDASGKPKYTEIVTAAKNSKGWTQDQALAMYLPAAAPSPTIQTKSLFEQLRLADPVQKDSVALWSQPKQSIMPPPVTYTKAETMVTKGKADVDTYMNEMVVKFIMGTEPLSNFDAFVKKCKDLGIDDIMDVSNDALGRYNKR